MTDREQVLTDAESFRAEYDKIVKGVGDAEPEVPQVEEHEGEEVQEHEEQEADEGLGQEEELEAAQDEDPDDEPQTPKELRRRFEQMREQRDKHLEERARLEERLLNAERQNQEIIKAIEEMASPKEPEDDYDDLDPALDRRFKGLEEKLTKQQEEEQAARKQQEAAKAREVFVQDINAMRRDFEISNPDYQDALNFYVKNQTQLELRRAKMDGKVGTEAEQEAAFRVAKAMQADSIKAYTKGESVPQMFYEMAQELGYKPKTKSGPDLEAIDKNRVRTATSTTTPGAGAPTSTGTSAESLKRILTENRKVDPAKFRQLVDKVKAGKR